MLEKLSRAELDELEACTCLSEAEIVGVFAKFRELGGQHAPLLDSHLLEDVDDEAQKQPTRRREKRVAAEDIVKLSEFELNPLAEQLCKTFSSDGSGALSFEDLLDLYNVLSPKAPRELKTQAAFRIYDYDGDGFLNEDDLHKLLKALSHGPGLEESETLSDEDIESLVHRVMAAGDVDRNNRLNYSEFRKIMNRIPDFPARFRVPIDS